VTPINVIPEVVAPVDNTVDLALSLSADKESLEVGDTIAYTVIVTNVHDSNTATSPTAGIVLPASLQFEASSTCTANELTIICETEELPPGASTEAAFSAKAVSVNSYSTVLATASSAQSESFVENNETQIITDISRITPQNVVTVTDQQASNNSTPAVTGTTSSKSGGGVLQLPAWVLLIAAAILYSRTPAIVTGATRLSRVASAPDSPMTDAAKISLPGDANVTLLPDAFWLAATTSAGKLSSVAAVVCSAIKSALDAALLAVRKPPNAPITGTIKRY